MIKNMKKVEEYQPLFITILTICVIIYRNFSIHQRKGGIHAIYRSIMDAFGYYRVTGLSPKIICPCIRGGH
jgi:hypothetical protein